jgi:LPXTG-site transpeptidase (sortase) family protein
MNRGLAFVSCNSGGITGAGLVTSVGTLDDVCSNAHGVATSPDPRDEGRLAEFDFGTLDNPTTGDITITIEYDAVVLNSLGNANGINLGNQVQWTWGSGNTLGPDSAPDVQIVEPRLQVTKTADPTLIAVGTEVTFTLTLSHDNLYSTTDAFDVVLIDELPAELGNVTGLDCTLGAQDPSTCIYSSGTHTLTATWPVFTRTGGNAIIVFRATVLSIPEDNQITNGVTGEWTSLPFDVSDPQSDYNDMSVERVFPPGSSVDTYIDTDEVVLRRASQPDTGFAPGRISTLDKSQKTTYADLGSISLEIPALGINIPIVGVPLNGKTWDLSWLSNQAGWLQETAYPTWQGNSVITGHVYLPSGLPGPFLNLGKIGQGEQIIIHAGGMRYTYQVQVISVVNPDDMTAFKHEENAWVTLVTCKEYDAKTDTYKKRIVVRARLVDVSED